jgi:signal transduction histidine kinase
MGFGLGRRPAGHSATPSLVAQFNRRLLAIGIAIAGAFLLVFGLATANRFTYLEEREVASHFDRADSWLNEVSHNLKARSLDWGVWDETWHYLSDGNTAYADANLGYTSVENLAVNGLAFVRTDGQVVNAVYADLAEGRFDVRQAQQFGANAQRIALAAKLANAASYQTFIVQDGRLLAISASRVMRSDGSGPEHGYIIFGQEITGQDVSSGLDLPVEIDLAHLATAQTFSTSLTDITMIRPLIGHERQPLAALRIMAPRSLMAEGFRLIAAVAIGAVALGGLLIAVFGRSVRQLVLTPLAAFQRHVASISETGELRPYDGDPRQDELGRLYGEFNIMASELTMLRAKVEAQSFIIGKRDNMTSLMHNIGNGIGPVKTILSRLETQLAQPLSRDVKRALDELAASEDPASRRARLVAFVDASLTTQQDEIATRRDLVRTALRSVDTVEGIVGNAMQDSKADPAADEVCEIGPVLANAAALARMRDAAITVSLDNPDRFRVRGNSVLLAQVLENLLKNAVEAIAANADSAGTGSGRIDVSAAAAQVSGLPAVSITIADNGDGFAPETAAGLFARGHSTRGKTVGGLGLHWCANTVNAMGGTLDIASDGPGTGARATVVLPLDPASYGKASEAA